MKLWFLVVLLLAACREAPPVPIDRLGRIEGPWVYPPKEMESPARKAPAAILVFRPEGEFIEHHCWVIEQPDQTLYISSADPRVISVGRWTRKGSTIRAVRHRVGRTVPFRGPKDPLCKAAELTFTISGSSVIGRTDGGQAATYEPLDHLVAPAFDAYIDDARRSSVKCNVEEDS